MYKLHHKIPRITSPSASASRLSAYIMRFADILRLNGTHGIADGGLFVVFTKIIGRPGQLHIQCTGAGTFGLGTVGAGVVTPVPPPDAPRAAGVVSGQGSSGYPQQGGNAAGQVVRNIIQLCRCTAEIEILRVFVAHHAVHGVDGLVGQCQRSAAQQHVQQRRNHAVAGVFRHGLHSGLGHAFGGKRLRVPPHDAAYGSACRRQVGLCQLPVDVHTLLHKSLCRQCLPAPEHLYCQPQQRVQGGSTHADKAGKRKGAHRQTKG